LTTWSPIDPAELIDHTGPQGKGDTLERRASLAKAARGPVSRHREQHFTLSLSGVQSLARKTFESKGKAAYWPPF
jgi:hypothetical protein